jgi:hypothetical protein
MFLATFRTTYALLVEQKSLDLSGNSSNTVVGRIWFSWYLNTFFSVSKKIKNTFFSIFGRE